MRNYKPLSPPRNKSEIAKQLRWLAEHMLDVATSIDYYGGMAEWGKHGQELAGAALVAKQWADEITIEGGMKC